MSHCKHLNLTNANCIECVHAEKIAFLKFELAEARRLLDEAKTVLKNACDRNWEDEDFMQVVTITANGLYWAHKTIEELQSKLRADREGMKS